MTAWPRRSIDRNVATSRSVTSALITTALVPRVRRRVSSASSRSNGHSVIGCNRPSASSRRSSCVSAALGATLTGETAPGDLDSAGTNGAFTVIAHPSRGFWIWNPSGGPAYRELGEMTPIDDLAAVGLPRNDVLVLYRERGETRLGARNYHCDTICTGEDQCSDLSCVPLTKAPVVVGTVTVNGAVAAIPLRMGLPFSSVAWNWARTM